MTKTRTESEDDAGKETITAVLRAGEVLGLFARETEPTLGISEIAARLGLSKAVVFRILSSLRSCGLVERDEATRRYRVGAESMLLGLAYLNRIDIRRMASEAMNSLSAATKETATLSIRTGWHRVYVDQVTPNLDIKMVVTLGRPFPLHAGSSSKAFLAFLPKNEQEEFFEQHKLERLTKLTITSIPRLRKELSEIRERGYAMSLGERQQGAGSVAAPILNRHGVPEAVISVCGPVDRFSKQIDRATSLLQDATAQISHQLGYRSNSANPAAS